MKDNLIKLCIDTNRGMVTDFSAMQTSEAIRKGFVQLVGTDKLTPQTFRKHENDIFEILEAVLDRAIEESWDKNVFFNQFVEYRDLNLGDENSFYVEDDSMLRISKVSNGHWDLRAQKLNIGSSFAIPVEAYSAKVYTDFRLFLAGRIDFGKLISKIEDAFKLHFATEVYGSFMSSMSLIPSEFQHTGSFSDDKMDEIISHVSAASGYQNLIIAGTRQALKEMVGSSYTGANSFLMSENMKNDLNQTGMIQTWNGIPLLEIPQVHQVNSFDFAVDDKRLMILPASTKPIKVVNEGSALIQQVMDGVSNQDQTMSYSVVKNMGIATIFDSSAYGFYELV